MEDLAGVPRNGNTSCDGHERRMSNDSGQTECVVQEECSAKLIASAK